MTGLLKTKIKRSLLKSPLGRIILKLLRLSLHLLRRLFGRIDLLYLDVTHACNLRCITCPTDAGVPKQGELTLEEKRKLKSRYFRTCTARQFCHTKLKIPIEYWYQLWLKFALMSFRPKDPLGTRSGEIFSNRFLDSPTTRSKWRE